ncbi:hypothetical protein [Novosphingobium olei]|uniref:hypothetical protein n=1 Tax=Novosphingobium olei TaxID=2728851 RepID=UPI003B8A810E
MARQYGQWKGKSFIRGGRANVRQALYMPASLPPESPPKSLSPPSCASSSS